MCWFSLWYCLHIPRDEQLFLIWNQRSNLRPIERKPFVHFFFILFKIYIRNIAQEDGSHLIPYHEQLLKFIDTMSWFNLSCNITLMSQLHSNFGYPVFHALFLPIEICSALYTNFIVTRAIHLFFVFSFINKMFTLYTPNISITHEMSPIVLQANSVMFSDTVTRTKGNGNLNN